MKALEDKGANIKAGTGASLICNNINFYNQKGAALYPNGDTSEVIVSNSRIVGGTYGVATNASTPDAVNISLKDSYFECTTPVFINVPGTLNVTNCEIHGVNTGIVVRGGTSVIKDTVAYCTEEDTSLLTYFDNRNWGGGNTLPLAALTLGNKHGSSYKYATNCTLINSKFISITAQKSGDNAKSYPALFAHANEEPKMGVTLTYDADCEFIGSFILDNKDFIVVNK